MLVVCVLSPAAASAGAVVSLTTVSPVSRVPSLSAFASGKAGVAAPAFSSARALTVPSLAPTRLAPAVETPVLTQAFGLSAGGVLSPLLGQKVPLELRLAPLFDGARKLFGDQPAGRSFQGGLSWPDWREREKIEDAPNHRQRRSPVAADLESTGQALGVDYAVDRSNRADHGEAFIDSYGGKRVALTADTLGASWAFIQAIKARELSWFHGWYQDVPASAERLAINYAHMAIAFAQMTDSSARSWATNLDHKHDGRWVVWEWYEALRKATVPGPGNVYPSFIGSDFFAWLRDYTAKSLSDDVSYRYSLYERYTGRFWRPGRPEHQQEIPAEVPRLGEAEYQAATRKFYGADGEGDGGSDRNLLGFVRRFFQNRGNQ